jgi:co-chaperonin GroES (HSP10)
MSLETHNITDITPLRKVILVRDIEQGDKLTKGGIIIIDDNGMDRGIRPRSCIVYKVGRDIDYLKPGETILVAHGRWTRGINMNVAGDKFVMHMVDPNDVLTVIEQE